MDLIEFLAELIKKESVTPKECGIYSMIKEVLSEFEVIEQEVGGVKNLFLYKDFSKEHSSLGMQCNRFSEFQEFAANEHSSLGNHSAGFENFEGSQTVSLVSSSKFSKNYESTTANIRMLGGDNAMESVESKLDSTNLDSRDSNIESLESKADSTDSTLCVESSNINPHEVRTLKACSGDKGQDNKEVAKGEKANALPLVTTPFSPFEDRRVESDNSIGDSKGLEDTPLASKLFKDSSVESKIDSTSLDSMDSNINSKLDSTLDSNIESKKPHLCFGGHIDVVPSGSDWSEEAFGGVIKDGYMYGRGTQDMKGGVAAFIYALKNIKSFNGILSLLLTSDEEGDGIYGTKVMLEELERRNLLPDFAIVAEPTCQKIFGDTIKVGRRGSINGVLKIHGVQGHVAYPELCTNPLDLLAPILPKLSNHLLDNGDSSFAPSRIVITDIRGGMEVVNVTPSELKIMFNVRNSPLSTKESLQSYIKSLLGEIPHTLELKQSSYPFLTNFPLLIDTMIDSIKEHTNITPTLSTSGGTSDARYFSSFGVEVVEFGVLNDRIHAIDECVKVSDIETLRDIFSTFISKIDKCFL